MVLTGFLRAESYAQLISAMLFFPFAVYFSLLVLPKRQQTFVISPVPASSKPIHRKKVPQDSKKDIDKTEAVQAVTEFDANRRTFLKLIGSAGIAAVLFSFLTPKTHAAFFGSVPGPGTVALKDSTGAQVDPAISTPTDGYKISDIDSSSPAYYGFIDKTGRWFIMKEGASGDYRYVKGTSSYSTNWTGRAALSYNTFDAVF